jgi:PAS domain S-box-containing protein
MAGAVCWYWVRKLQARFLAGAHASAVEAAVKTGQYLWTVPSHLEVAEYHYYGALARAAHHDAAPPADRPLLLSALWSHHAQLAEWAQHCPENFADRAALCAAELARIEGRDLDAERLYEEAIRAAHDSGFVHNEAIVHETASRFYRRRGFQVFADTYLRAARDGYLRWGADAKVRQLDQLHPQLVPRVPLGPAATIGILPEQLDLRTVIKASQAISSQIVLEELVETLMCVVLENAGAQTASLILARGDGLSLATVASADGQQGVSVRRPADEAISPSELPLSLLNYVRRSREQVLLADATQPNPFSADEHLATRKPRSILCLPILRQTALIGLLYLENNLVSNAFTPDRLAVLELLAGQAAISLENARLYTDLRHENSERRQAEAALRESQGLLQGIIDNATASIYVKDIEGRFLLVNRHLADLFGVDRATLLGKTDHDLLPRARADAVRAFDQRVLAAGTALEAEEVAPLEDGLHTYLSIKAPLLDAAGRPYALCGISTDITERTRAGEQLRASLREKEVLLKEVHHRVKNNLQLVNSLLALQAAQTGDPRVEGAFLEIQNRVRAMTLVHESLYRARDFASVRLTDHIEDLCAHLYRSYSVDPERIALDLHIADVPLDLDLSLRCGLIVNELVSNAIKHAFPSGRAGRISVRFAVVADGYVLSVADDGVGLPPGFDLHRAGSLGIQLVMDLADQLEALAIGRDGGTTFTIRFRAAGEGAAGLQAG